MERTDSAEFPLDLKACREMLRELIDLDGREISEQLMLAEVCTAVKRAHLAASSRMDRHWQELLRMNPLSPMPVWGITGRELQVVPHLSYRTGLVTDYQGITVTASAHAPACHRLLSHPAGGAEPTIVAVEGFEAWLQETAERGAVAERERVGDACDVETATGSCVCLEGTLVLAPRSYPDQPEDIVYLVGEDLQERYLGLFEERRFIVHAVTTLKQITGIKNRRWDHLGTDEVCDHEPQHDAWGICPTASADLTFECDRHCDTGCDWVLYPLDGRARLAVHGDDIDLGPIEEDHTAELTDYLLPQLRI
jgi:hypothetical protein